MSVFLTPAQLQARPSYAQSPQLDGLYPNAQPLPPVVLPSGHSARLITYREGRKEALLVSWDKPVVIGRNERYCTYIIPESVVSNIHCKIYAVRTHTGNTIISCQDFSTNGVILNGVKIRKESLLLVDGDELQIPESQTFTCSIPTSRRRAKANIFEPTPPPQNEDFRTMGKYRISSHALGSGSYGTVYLAMDMNRRRQVACKTIRISHTGSATMPNDVMKEVNILKSLRHPNINCVWDIEHFETFTYLFLELSTGGDLDMYIRKRGSLPEDEAKYLSYQLMKGLYYLHDLHIAHRDLKPENILLHEAGSFPRVIIADFGLARPRAFEETFRVAGTISYLPPEAITALNCKHIGYVGQPSDCWALGVCIYIMLDGFHPFDYETGSHILDPDDSLASAISEELIERRIIGGELDFPDPTWTQLREGTVPTLTHFYLYCDGPDAEVTRVLKARSLICRLLVHSPRLRLTIPGALESVWILADCEHLGKLYRKQVKLRGA